MLEKVARLAVPGLADWCSVQLADQRQVAVAHVDPEKVRWALELQERYPPDPDAPTGAPAVIRNGRSELYPVIDRALLEAAALDEEQIAARARAADALRDGRPAAARAAARWARSRSCGPSPAASTRRASSSWPRSSAAAPGSRSTTRGCTRASTPPRRRSSARCCPPTLPALPGYELVVRYVPSDARDHAGGDWYDAFMLPDGRVGIVIGDVGGRGMDAAATMGQIRNALRAYAVKGAGPAAVIDDLHALVAASAGAITFVTVVYVVLDLATGAGELASAGHLPALLAGARLRRRAALPAARLQRRRRVPARALHARARRDAVAVHRRADRVAPAHARRRPRGARAGRRARDREPRRDRRPARRRAPRGSATTTSPCSGYAASARCSSAWRSTRETCICEIPTRSAISRWTRSSTKRRRRISRSRGVSSRRQLLDPQRVLDAAEPGVLAAQQLREVAVLALHGRVERGHPRRVVGQQRLGDVLDVHAAVLGDLAGGREAAELLAQRLGGLLDARDRLLDAARHVDRPRAVAEVALELAEDRRHGVGGEGDPAVGVVAVDRLDEAEVRDLAEVVERLAGVAVLDRQRTRQAACVARSGRPRRLVPRPGPYPQLPHRSTDATGAP